MEALLEPASASLFSIEKEHPTLFMVAMWLMIWLVTIASCLPQALFADKCGACGGCGEVVLQFGEFAARQGKSQHVNIQGLIGDDFCVKKAYDQNFLAGVGYYFNGWQTAKTTLLYGVNAFYLAPTKVSGTVIQEDLFTNLSYRYFIKNYPLYVAAKMLIPCKTRYALVLDIGMGPNIVKTRDFKEKSLDGGITIPDEHFFSGKTTVTFSATAGLGFRVCMLSDLIVELNYRFFYLGQGQLKKRNNQIRNPLHTGNGYAHAVFISIVI